MNSSCLDPTKRGAFSSSSLKISSTIIKTAATQHQNIRFKLLTWIFLSKDTCICNECIACIMYMSIPVLFQSFSTGLYPLLLLHYPAHPHQEGLTLSPWSCSRLLSVKRCNLLASIACPGVRLWVSVKPCCDCNRKKKFN